MKKDNRKMKKREYQAPLTEQLHVATTSHLLDWSAPKDDGNGGNVPEAKQYDFEDEEFCPWETIWDDPWKDLDDNLKNNL